MKLIARLMFGLCLAGGAAAQAATQQVEFQTSSGTFVVELYPEKAPKTVENFLGYVNSGFYEGTIFHRVVEKFVVQGGGVTAELYQKQTKPPIPNESDNGLKNERGTLAMARKYDAHSATSQFFINVADNKILNYYKPDSAHIGYCVFGRVIRGMDVVEKISHVPTKPAGRLTDLPSETIVIEKVAVLETPVLADAGAPPAPEPAAAPSAKPAKKGKKRG